MKVNLLISLYQKPLFSIYIENQHYPKYKSYESIKNENVNQSELFLNEKPNPFFVWDALSDLPKIKAGQNGEEKDYTSEPKNDYQKLAHL